MDTFNFPITLQDAEESLLKNKCNNNKRINKYNLQVLNDIDNKLNVLQELSNKTENEFEIAKSLSYLFNALKSNYLDIYMKLKNKAKENIVKNTKKLSKSYCSSPLSIVDIQMELCDLDEETLSQCMNDITFTDIKGLQQENKKICTFKECATNTATETEDKETEMEIFKLENKEDLKKKCKQFSKEVKDVQQMIEMLMKKNSFIESKCEKAFHELSMCKNIYRKTIKSIFNNTAEIGVNTCENLINNLPEMVETNTQLSFMMNELTELEQQIEIQEQEISKIREQNDENFQKIEDLIKENLELSNTKESLTSDLCDLKDMNDFQKAEFQGLQAQIEKIRSGWSLCAKEHNEYVQTLRKNCREERLQLTIERCELHDKLRDFELLNIGTRMEAEFLGKAMDEFIVDVTKYPTFGREIVELKKTITLLEDKALAHAAAKERWVACESRLTKEIINGNSLLNETKNMLKKTADELETDNEKIRIFLKKYSNCFNELKSICSETDDSNPSKFILNLRAILSKHSV